MPPFDVFISYRWVSPEQEWVRECLYPALQAAGLAPLLDVEDFVPGRDLMLEMMRAKHSSRHALCVLTPAYFDGERMVHFESLMARRDDPAGMRSALIPLILRPTELPEWLRGLVPLDWVEPRHRPREWRKLLKLLGALEPNAPPPGDVEANAPLQTAPAPARAPVPVDRITLTADGQIAGGIDALRRSVVEWHGRDWDGSLNVRTQLLEKGELELAALRALPALSVEQARDFDAARDRISWANRTIRDVETAIRLSFMRAPNREATWGVPMNNETALDFICGLLGTAGLIAPASSDRRPCQLFVPQRVDDPVAIDLRLPTAEVETLRASWINELQPFEEYRWETWDWPDLVPLWHASNGLIARLLLPTMVLRLSRGVEIGQPFDIGGAWQGLATRFAPVNERDPLVPFDWCLALDSDASVKDLAWKTSPPPARCMLQDTLGYRPNDRPRRPPRRR
jgi:TIR domain